MTAFNVRTEDDYGRQIKAILANTAKDGSGTWYFPLVNSDGKMMVADGATPVEAPFTGAAAILAATAQIAPGAAFRLLRFELHLSAAPSSSENLVVAVDDGVGATYDTKLINLDLSKGSIADLIVDFGKGYEFKSTDVITAAYTNTDTRTYGLKFVYELI